MARPSVERLTAALRDACDDAGLKQEAIAEALGVHQTTVSKWLLGKTQPPLEHLWVIEEMCGLPRGRLLHIAGFVEPDDGVEAAIATDTVLDEDSKAAVVKLYRTFVRLSTSADSV